MHTAINFKLASNSIVKLYTLSRFAKYVKILNKISRYKILKKFSLTPTIESHRDKVIAVDKLGGHFYKAYSRMHNTWCNEYNFYINKSSDLSGLCPKLNQLSIDDNCVIFDLELIDGVIPDQCEWLEVSREIFNTLLHKCYDLNIESAAELIKYKDIINYLDMLSIPSWIKSDFVENIYKSTNGIFLSANIHGDFKKENVLKVTGDKNFKLIDWETFHRAPAYVDILKCTNCFLRSKHSPVSENDLNQAITWSKEAIILITSEICHEKLLNSNQYLNIMTVIASFLHIIYQEIKFGNTNFLNDQNRFGHLPTIVNMIVSDINLPESNSSN